MRKLKNDETIFRDESVFDPSYLPEEFLFRDSEMQELAFSIKPAMKGGKGTSCLIFGKPATGKTTSVKKIIEEANSEKFIAVYVNCHIYNSWFRILSEIHKKVFGFLPPESGVPIASMYDKVFAKLSKEKKTLLVVLDDLNFHSGANEIIYNLLKAYEAHNVKTFIWCISTSNELHKLDDKSRSLFVANVISFKPYNSQQIKEILKKRMIAGLHKDAASDQVLSKIAQYSGDLRQAIELLKNSARIAESLSSSKILDAHVSKSLQSVEKSSITNDNNLILERVKKGPIESGELFEIYKKESGLGYTKFYRTLKKLEAQNILKIERLDKKRGKTSLISLKK